MSARAWEHRRRRKRFVCEVQWAIRVLAQEPEAVIYLASVPGVAVIAPDKFAALGSVPLWSISGAVRSRPSSPPAVLYRTG